MIDGFEVQSRMQAEQTLVPTVIITGHDSPDSRRRAMLGGAAAFLRKPADDQMLLDAIEKAIATNSNHE